MRPFEALETLKANADSFVTHWLGDDDPDERRDARAEAKLVKQAYAVLLEKLND